MKHSEKEGNGPIKFFNTKMTFLVSQFWSILTQIFYSALLMLVFIGLAYVSAVGDRSGVVTEDELTNWGNMKQEKAKEGTRVIGDHPLEKERVSEQIIYHQNCFQDHSTPTSGSDNE
nr:uncharacterized protein LOC106686843 [Halyomorpha halys]